MIRGSKQALASLQNRWASIALSLQALLPRTSRRDNMSKEQAEEGEIIWGMIVKN